MPAATKSRPAPQEPVTPATAPITERPVPGWEVRARLQHQRNVEWMAYEAWLERNHVEEATNPNLKERREQERKDVVNGNATIVVETAEDGHEVQTIVPDAGIGGFFRRIGRWIVRQIDGIRKFFREEVQIKKVWESAKRTGRRVADWWFPKAKRIEKFGQEIIWSGPTWIAAITLMLFLPAGLPLWGSVAAAAATLWFTNFLYVTIYSAYTKSGDPEPVRVELSNDEVVITGEVAAA